MTFQVYLPSDYQFKDGKSEVFKVLTGRTVLEVGPTLKEQVLAGGFATNHCHEYKLETLEIVSTLVHSKLSKQIYSLSSFFIKKTSLAPAWFRENDQIKIFSFS